MEREESEGGEREGRGEKRERKGKREGEGKGDYGVLFLRGGEGRVWKRRDGRGGEAPRYAPKLKSCVHHWHYIVNKVD